MIEKYSRKSGQKIERIGQIEDETRKRILSLLRDCRNFLSEVKALLKKAKFIYFVKETEIKYLFYLIEDSENNLNSTMEELSSNFFKERSLLFIIRVRVNILELERIAVEIIEESDTKCKFLNLLDNIIKNLEEIVRLLDKNRHV
jgi:hypothetical protein